MTRFTDFASGSQSVVHSKGIRGCISIIATLKCANILVKIIMFCYNNRRTSLIGDVFTLYHH